MTIKHEMQQHLIFSLIGGQGKGSAKGRSIEVLLREILNEPIFLLSGPPLSTKKQQLRWAQIAKGWAH